MSITCGAFWSAATILFNISVVTPVAWDLREVRKGGKAESVGHTRTKGNCCDAYIVRKCFEDCAILLLCALRSDS